MLPVLTSIIGSKATSLLTNKYVIVGLIVVMLIVFTYQKGAASTKQKTVDIPKGELKDIPEGWTPAELAGRLYYGMEGFNISVTDKELAWKSLYELPTDAMVVAVYNYYNQQYLENLTRRIAEEGASWVGSYQDRVLERLRNLNLD